MSYTVVKTCKTSTRKLGSKIVPYISYHVSLYLLTSVLAGFDFMNQLRQINCSGPNIPSLRNSAGFYIRVVSKARECI